MYKVDGESVWVGPPTVELSRQALRKSFAHQISKASAIWWFDMWGGWYDDPLLMDELIKMKQICDKELGKEKAKLSPEIVFFADETGYANMFNNAPQLHGIIGTRTAMGNIGAPYDSVMVEDAEAVLKNYKAAIFPMPIASETGKKAMELCKKLGIPYLCATPEHYELTVDELRSFITNSNVHLYLEEKDVVYAGNGYVGLHTATGGHKEIKLPARYSVTGVFGANISKKNTDTIQFELNENETALFAIDSIK
jgi:beta-galactosidase